MGMGKTYQTLAFLGGLMRARTIRNAVILAPLSVLRSWEKEASHVVKSCVNTISIEVVSSDISKRRRQQILRSALEW
jgi:SNF2 family DNA or RNA helicase